ncbi:alanine--tRNA ligase [Candidatus Saccharibacteria bacterium]|nr:alanine--tRNA ligase [Candidatus Saccharibacteria bacterium]
MNASEIRQKFLDFQVSKGHKIISPAPLVLENDPTTLFTGSGMQPLLRFLLGEKHPAGSRLTDSQPCLRLQDIEDVGDPRHTTVFEILGNWSLGDYFKKEQIENYFEFLTKVIGLDPNKIFVTCFIGNEKYGIPRDDEAAKIWQDVFKKAGVEAKIVEIGSAKNGDARGIKSGERIFFYDDKENWWSRGGGIETTPIGDPCGPDSEVFYDFGEDKQDVEKYGQSHPASDGARFMEIGNQVFMQFRREPDGSFSELEHKNVDFGGGLERLCAAAMGSFDVFQTSLMKPIIKNLETLSGKSYDNNTDEMRIIADHLRGAYLLSAEGLAPSNKAQGYALRRLIRRAILKALDLGIAKDFLKETIAPIADEYRSLSDEILTCRDSALSVLEKEEHAFRQTLTKGLREMQKLSARSNNSLTGADLFMLQDTYGFPFEISVEEAYRQGIKLSSDYKAEFDNALKIQRERSQTASKGMFKGGLEDHGEKTTKYHTATHLLLAALQKHIDAKITQKGSNITADRLRFDFNLDHKMTKEELSKVEAQVNDWIQSSLPVSFAEYDKAYAKDVLKAHGQFWDKYPDRLKVYIIGDPDAPVSREVCGGPHVSNTSELGKFVIKKEESSSAGVRRIKAVLE